jgi:putative addiction module CopG family antidote
MNVSLPPPLQEFVRQKVADGVFRTTDEVVCEALRLLQHEDTWKGLASEAIEEGWKQAQSGELRTPEQVRENLAARKDDWKKQHGK